MALAGIVEEEFGQFDIVGWRFDIEYRVCRG